MTMNKEKFQALMESTELLNDHIDYAYILASEDFDDEDELKEYMQERISEQEIIYYHNAIDFLRDNDPSLNDSLSLADEMGSSVKDLNSEKLATLLLQQKLNKELGETDFSECFE